MDTRDIARNVTRREMQRLAAKPDANKAFQEAMKTVRKHLADLDKALDREAAKQAKDPLNWGYSGDLGRVIESLDELVRFLG